MCIARRKPTRKLAVLCLMACLIVPNFLIAKPASAADDLNATALSLVPEDAAFFGTSLNMKLAWQDFAQGKFVTRLRAVPFVQQLEGEFWQQWDNPSGPLAQGKAALENPNIRNVLRLGQDMMTDELFVYGGQDWCEMIEGLMEFQNDMTSTMSQGPEALQEYFQSLEKEDVDRIRIPTTIIGFRLSDGDNARMQLDALEGIFRIFGGQIEQVQPFLKQLKRADFRDGQRLSFTLDASLVPLDQFGDEEREVAERAVELLEGRSLTLTLAVKAKMLLIAFGEGDSLIENFGSSPNKLIESDVFDVVKQAAPTNLRGLSYVSARWNESQWNANFGKYFQRLSAQFAGAVGTESENIEELAGWVEEIQQDAAWLDERLAEASPEFGPVVSWTRAIEGGTEGYVYDWSDSNTLENGKPLKVIDHAGTSPLLLLAFKQRELEVVTEMCEYLLERAPEHIRRFIQLAETGEEEQAKALEILEQAWPIVEDTYEILSSQIGPSLAANEHMFVASGNWTTTMLAPNLPPAQKALPLPELASVCMLNDRKLFLSGCEDLYGIFDRIVELVRELDENAIPEGYTVPRPIEEKIGSATKYSYAELSAAVPLDGFEPQLIVADDVIILGYSDRQVTDMLRAKALQTRPGWLTASTPAASVAYFDFAGMMEAGRPWIEYGLSFTGLDLDDPVANQPGPIPTGNDILQIWDCFSAVGTAAATVTIGEDGPTVTRWVWVGE